MIWKISVSEVKRAKNFHIFSAEQGWHSQFVILSRRNVNVSAARFAPHLSKCLGIGGRGQASKKSIRSDFSESESVTKGSSHTPQDFASASRIDKAEHEALLSNAITNVISTSTSPEYRSRRSTTSSPQTAPHPLSQSHIATPPVSTQKEEKNAIQVPETDPEIITSIFSSDSEEEEEEEEGDEEEEGEGEGELEEGGDDQQTSTPAAGRMDDDNEGSNGAYSNGTTKTRASHLPQSLLPQHQLVVTQFYHARTQKKIQFTG
ncbi:hypothetical protein H4Q26_001388 [Puccinia striiformis f. sp. tritici PST-130]|nr:hypothetical protein H4Q26_001388 [Puccinia striiformis f. sp. tritici PST-130]